MGRVQRVILVLLLVVTVATVLVTPDPTDDVQGLLHRPHVQFSLTILSLFRLSLGFLSSGILSCLQAPSHTAQTDELMNLLCVRLC